MAENDSLQAVGLSQRSQTIPGDVEYIDFTQGCMGKICVSSRGAQSTELVSLYIGYWTLNNYYYYY